MRPQWGFYIDNVEDLLGNYLIFIDFYLILDAPGEWYYDKTNQRVLLYSTSNPSGKLVEAIFTGHSMGICVFFNPGFIIRNLAFRHQSMASVWVPKLLYLL